MLIGITGRPGAGQDIAADYLASANRFAIVTFDRPLRAMLRAGFELTEEHFQNEQMHIPVPGVRKTPAQLLQSLRWQWIRTNTDPNTLLEPAREALADARRLGIDVVVPDVYTQAEADLVREFGGRMLRLVNDTAKDLGPAPCIKLLELERELVIPAKPFALYDALDAYVGEELFCEAIA